MQEPVPVTGVWLRVSGGAPDSAYDVVEVLVEVDGSWRQVVVDRACSGPVSHIVEPSGIRKAPAPEWLT